jgi:2-keto-4-pentenoate hydratase/2-oxohepta-3-ene-1,7-dioic acid hydratase in catechol pathway
MYRLLNIDGRAALEEDGRWFDLATLSGDPALADPMAAVARSAELHGLAERCGSAAADGKLAGARLGPPVPAPRQVFGIGLNYRDHAGESGMDLPPAPLTFTKFPSCIAGPHDEVPLSGELVDWEAEVVVVIGTETTAVPVDEAWSAVAGLMLGQDISDRGVQLTGSPAQFCLGKSFAAYGPTGPALVSVDSFADPDDIGLWCDVAGERMQEARSSLLIFPVPTLVAYLSSITTLFPGDLIFTGTPSGVGMARGRFLAPGELVVTGAEVIGELRNPCVAGRGPLAL